MCSIYKLNCRCCGSNNLKRVLSLGYQPLANNLKNSSTDKDELYPLELNVCVDCFNCQLSVSIDSNKMFSNYLYQSSTTEKFKDHFKTLQRNIFMNLTRMRMRTLSMLGVMMELA